MKLVKPAIDIGLFTTDAEPIKEFWAQEVGAVFDHVQPVKRGHKQHRMDLDGTVLKINKVYDLKDDGERSGYREVLVAREGLTEPKPLIDPDGNKVTLVPKGYLGIEQNAIRLGVSNLTDYSRYLKEALSLTETQPGVFSAGESRIILEEDKEGPKGGGFERPGYRYITFQIADAVGEMDRFLASGGQEGMPIFHGGKVAIYALVRDPDGNWLELSQRAELTGELPEA